MLEILIKNAEVIDGTGKPGFRADVGMAEKRIVQIAEKIAQEADIIIQAEGLHLAPGFIDPHMHSGLTLLANRRAESSIHQGVTTEIIGNCGFSQAPIIGASVEEVITLSKGLDIEITWNSMDEYLDQLRKPGTALNVVPLVGHNTVRGSVLGYDNVQPTSKQQAEMEHQVDAAMKQGARGISTGFIYPPGCYSHLEEIIGLAKIASKHGGIYSSHIRDEGDKVLEAVDEALEIGLQAEIPLEYSHIKIIGHRNWGLLDKLISVLESDKARDVKLGCDQYPYTASSTVLSSVLPFWAQQGGGNAIAIRMKDPSARTRIVKNWNEKRMSWDNRSGVGDWKGILITDCLSRPEVIGMTVEEIASQDRIASIEAALDLISLDDAQVVAVFFDQQEDILSKLMQHPLVAIGSDSNGAAPYGVLGKGRPHPRHYGTFPRVLGRYVREKSILSLEEAVKKMTSLTAERFNLVERGVVCVGAWADLVLFDARTVIDKATFADPHQYPEGIPYVIVNGEIVLDKGEHTGALPGRVL